MWRCPALSKRLRLLGYLWLGRLGLIWILAYPIYRPIADSHLLHSSRTDRELLRAGGETLLALLEARASSLNDLSAAMGFVAVAAATLGLAGSSLAWVVMSDPQPLFGHRIPNRVCAVLPAFAITSVVTVGVIALLTWCWWQLFSVIGAWLEPVLGERCTDLVQLFFVTCLVGAIAVLCTLADVVRAVVAAERVPFRWALPSAARRYKTQPTTITLHAAIRFVLALSLHLTNGWLVSHYAWLSGPSWLLLLGIATSETAAILAIWLRLDWIAWTVKAQTRLIPRPQ